MFTLPTTCTDKASHLPWTAVLFLLFSFLPLHGAVQNPPPLHVIRVNLPFRELCNPREVAQYKEERDRHVKQYGKGDLRTATATYNLGNAYYRQERWEDAKSCYQQVLLIANDALGDHPNIATCINNLGTTYHKQGLHEKAKNCFFQALIMYIKCPTTPFRDMARCYYNLGSCAIAQENYEKGAVHFEQAKNFYGKDPERNQFCIMSCLAQLMQCHLYRGNYEKVLASYKEALPLPDASQENYFIRATLSEYVGIAHKYQGNYPAALLYLQEALKFYEKVSAPIHDTLHNCLNNLGTVHYYQGNYAQARQCHQDVFDPS